MNWPDHRGTATAFPLSAYGLSAFFFATLSSLAFENDPSQFLLLLAIGTFTMIFIGFFFLRIVPHPTAYSSLSTEDARGRSNSNPLLRSNSNALLRSKSTERKHHARHLPAEPGMQPSISCESIPKDSVAEVEAPEVHNKDTEETSSLLSQSSSSAPGDLDSRESDVSDATGLNSRRLDISGLALICTIKFWQLFILLGLLAGVGLMTIK